MSTPENSNLVRAVARLTGAGTFKVCKGFVQGTPAQVKTGTGLYTLILDATGQQGPYSAGGTPWGDPTVRDGITPFVSCSGTGNIINITVAPGAAFPFALRLTTSLLLTRPVRPSTLSRSA